MARSFNRWFSRRNNKYRVATTDIVGTKETLVKESSSGVWSWKGGGLKKYRRELGVNLGWKEDVLAAKDCIVRACTSTWWDWVIESRPFFWRWPVDCWL